MSFAPVSSTNAGDVLTFAGNTWRPLVAGAGAHTPVTQGLASWAYDPALCAATLATTNGTVYLVKLMVSADVTVTKIYWHVATVAVTPTASQSEVGLFSSAGTKLASTNVDADVLSVGTKTTTITGQALTAGSFVWVGMVFNAATPVGIARLTAVTGVATLSNIGLATAATRFATNGTGATALPSSVTPGSNTQLSSCPWAAIGA